MVRVVEIQRCADNELLLVLDYDRCNLFADRVDLGILQSQPVRQILDCCLVKRAWMAEQESCQRGGVCRKIDAQVEGVRQPAAAHAAVHQPVAQYGQRGSCGGQDGCCGAGELVSWGRRQCGWGGRRLLGGNGLSGGRDCRRCFGGQSGNGWWILPQDHDCQDQYQRSGAGVYKYSIGVHKAASCRE